MIRTVADDLLEPRESFMVTLTNPRPSDVVSVSGTDGSAESTIGVSGRTVTASVAGATVSEGERALFPVTLSGKVSADVTVNYTITDVTTTGTGDGADYTSAATAITIKAGATTGTITVDTAEESVAEDNETFTVTLTLPADSPISLGAAAATGTIRDDDPLRVTLEGPGQVPEGEDASDYKVRLTGGTGSTDITVRHTRDGVAQAPVTITAGTTEVALPDISTGADPLVEGHTIVVRITGVSTTSGTVNLGSPREKRTRIVDGDTMTVSISGGGAATEGSDATFTVTRSANATPDGDVTVRYQVVAGSASSSDYAAPSGTLELGRSASGPITVPVEPDELAERAETFSVRLTSVRSSAPSDKVVLGNTTATATIAASDPLTATVRGNNTFFSEGQSATFVVNLDGTSSERVMIDYVVSDTEGADDDVPAQPEDYTPRSGQLAIGAGRSSGTIVIRAVDDDVLEQRESFTVTLDRVAPSDVFEALPDPKPSAESTIEFSDRTVRVSVADVTADEGDPAVFTVSLDGEVGANVTVTPVFAHVTTEDADFTGSTTPSPAAVTIMAGETTATFTVETMDDILAEDTETFTVTLGTLTMPTGWPSGTGGPDGIELGRAMATGTVTDDTVSVNLRGATTVNEGDAAEYTVSLSGYRGDEDIIVTFTVESDTATSQDYSPASGTLTLNSEESSGTFTIQVVDEPDVVDLRESLVVSIEAQTSEGDPIRTEGPLTTTIVDDGTVQVSVEADPEIVPESRQEATFTVTLSGTVADRPVTLSYQTQDGTATAPADYTADDGTLTIAPGETSATITVPVNDDGQEELTDETFTMNISALSLPTGVAIETATATVTITDHALEASVSAPATVNEGQPATFTVSLTPEDQNRSGVTVDYELGGTAVAPGDYVGPASGTLTIPAGQDSGAITRTTNSDGMLDPDETLSVTLSNPRTLDGGLAALGSPTTATVTIVDQQTVTWSVANIEFDESQDAVFTVMLDGPVQDGVTLTFETIAGGTATAGTDYTAVSNRQVTVAGGGTTATFTVEVEDDDIGEANETFMVRLTLASDAPAGVEPPSGTATATIRDDDLALLPIASKTVAEGNDAIIELRLDRMTTEPVTLSYETVDGSATFGDDYLILLGGARIPASGTVPLPPGIQSGAVTVRAVDDSLAENTETFTVRVVLSNGGSPQEATVTITDNDTLRVSVSGPETVEEGAAATYTVKLEGDNRGSADVAVTYTVGGTAKAPDDYTRPSGSVVIAARQQTATFAIQTKADNVLERDETLVVTLTEATTAAGSAGVGSPKSATTAIQDPGYHSINRVNRTLLPGVVRASTASALEAVGWRMAEGAGGDPAATADLAGLTGLYRALQANEYALQDGSYDLAKVLGGSSFLVPLSSHDGDSDGGVGFAVWGGGDFRTIGGGAEDAVKWDGSVWSARVGADVRFVDSLLTGMVVSYASGALDYTDATPQRKDGKGIYGTWLASVHPYVGWTTPDFGLWASGGFGRGGLTLDDAAEDAQESDITQWSLGGGASVTLLSGDWLVAGGTTALKLKADGFLGGATAHESENKLLEEVAVGVNQVRAAIEASHAQHFAGGGSLKPSLEIGGRYDGGDGETGAGLEVGGGLTYADPGSGLTAAATGRALMLRDNYGEWGVSGLLQWDPDAGRGLMMSVRPTFGVTASGVSGLWEHGTLELLSGSQPGGRVEAEIGYGLPAFGMTGVLTPFAGAALTDAGAYSLSVGGRLELSPAFDLTLEAERSESADPSAAPEHDVTLEGSFRW